MNLDSLTSTIEHQIDGSVQDSGNSIADIQSCTKPSNIYPHIWHLNKQGHKMMMSFKYIFRK